MTSVLVALIVGQLAGQVDELGRERRAADAQLLELHRAGVDRVGVDRAREGHVDGLRRLVGPRLAADRVEVAGAGWPGAGSP